MEMPGSRVYASCRTWRLWSLLNKVRPLAQNMPAGADEGVEEVDLRING
jgi:hypothetical protein